MTDTDEELIERWRGGDERAGSALVKRHFSALLRFFANKAHGHEEDLIQQTFVACVEARDAFRGESSFRSYLFALARFQLLTHYRKVYRHAEQALPTTSLQAPGTSPSGEVARRQDQEMLELALQRIPIDQRIALELSYWEGMTASEVAHVIGIPENTVYSRMRRAKRHLRKALEDISIAPEGPECALRLLEAKLRSPAA